MPESLLSLMAVPAGAALGSIYFGGLWWTTRCVGSFRRPVRGILVSVLLRMSIALGGFYLVAGGHWQRLMLCLLGFVAARAAVSWLTRLPKPETGNGPTDLQHAP